MGSVRQPRDGIGIHAALRMPSFGSVGSSPAEATKGVVMDYRLAFQKAINSGEDLTHLCGDRNCHLSDDLCGLCGGSLNDVSHCLFYTASGIFELCDPCIMHLTGLSEITPFGDYDLTATNMIYKPCPHHKKCTITTES